MDQEKTHVKKFSAYEVAAISILSQLHRAGCIPHTEFRRIAKHPEDRSEKGFVNQTVIFQDFHSPAGLINTIDLDKCSRRIDARQISGTTKSLGVCFWKV